MLRLPLNSGLRATAAIWLMTLLLGSCHSAGERAPAGAPSPSRVAGERLLAAHDSLMVMSGKLVQLRKKLATRAESLATDSAQPAAQAQLARLRSARRALQTADDAMMDWMHAFRAPDSTALPSARLAYYQQQQVALDSVGRVMRAAQDSAQALLSAPAAR